MIADRPSGFRLGNIKADSVLSKMGLRNGVVIREVNGEAITGPDQAAMFFQTIKEGDDIAIKINRLPPHHTDKSEHRITYPSFNTNISTYHQI
jgi:type II secretory pathway component PulC